MLTNIDFITLNLFSIVSCILAYNALVVQKKKDHIQGWNLAYGVMALALLLGHWLMDRPLKELLLLSLLGLVMGHLALLKKSLTRTFSITIQAGLYGLLYWLPLDKLPLDEDFFIDSNGIIFLSVALVIVILYRSIKETPLKTHLARPLAMVALSTIFVFLTPPTYSIPIMTVLISISGVYHIRLVFEENQVYENEMALKIKLLEKEFNEEVRKAVNRHTFHLKEVQEKMSHINKIDNLTKAYNKKAIFNIIDDLCQDRRVPTFSVIMFDIDHFKTLNDTLGHAQGDICLKSLSTIAFECIRDTDYLGRFGGDEFMIVLPHADLKRAQLIAERFRHMVDKDTSPHFTLSIGLANFPHDGDNLKTLLDISDKGLYVSKEKGRNSVSYYNENKK